jgi:hypothetical protein
VASDLVIAGRRVHHVVVTPAAVIVVAAITGRSRRLARRRIRKVEAASRTLSDYLGTGVKTLFVTDGVRRRLLRSLDERGADLVGQAELASRAAIVRTTTEVLDPDVMLAGVFEFSDRSGRGATRLSTAGRVAGAIMVAAGVAVLTVVAIRDDTSTSPAVAGVTTLFSVDPTTTGLRASGLTVAVACPVVGGGYTLTPVWNPDRPTAARDDLLVQWRVRDEGAWHVVGVWSDGEDAPAVSNVQLDEPAGVRVLPIVDGVPQPAIAEVRVPGEADRC